MLDKEKLIRFIKQHPILYKNANMLISAIQRSKRRNKFLRWIINAASGRKIVSLAVNSVFNYQQHHNKPVYILEPEQMRRIYIPRNIPVRENDCIEYARTPSIYYTKMEDVFIIGESNAILTGDNAFLSDKLLLEYSDEIKFTVGPIIQFENDRCSIEVDKHNLVIDEGIYLIGEGSNNYYHWVFDILSRVLYLNQLEEYRDVPLLIDETVVRHPTCMELLEKVDMFHHPQMFLKRGRTYEIRSLVYLSPTTWSTVYQNESVKRYSIARYAKSNNVVDAYRSFLLNHTVEADEAFPKKLFITRGNDKKKRLVNEQELCECSVKYGFVPYDPSSDSIEMQAKCFSNADYIVGASGAAFVNLMWCKKGCKVVCVSPIAYNDFNYSTLADLVGAECIYIDGKMIDGLYHTVDVTIFENTLKELLKI